MEDRQIRIHNAVRQCVRQSHASLTPFFAISKFCDRLRSEGVLSSQDIEQVESLAWRELQTIRGEFGHDR